MNRSKYILVELLLILAILGLLFLALLFHPTIYWVVAGGLNATHFVLVIGYSRARYIELFSASFLVPVIYLIYPAYLAISIDHPIVEGVFVPLVYYVLGAFLLIVHLKFNLKSQELHTSDAIP